MTKQMSTTASSSASSSAGDAEGIDSLSFGSMEVEYLDDWRANLVGETRLGEAMGPDSWFWTGKAPVAGTPGVTADGIATSLPLVDPAVASRQDLLDYFDNTWMLTEVLFSSLQSEEAYYRPPWHDLRHPMIFYYGHPASVYVNKCRVAGLVDKPVSPFLEKIFETGVDEMTWDDMHKNIMRWPTVEHTREYRARVYDLIAETIVSSPHYESLAEKGPDSPFWAVVMGFEHERIHLETSSVLIRELPLSLVRRPQAWPAEHPSMAQAKGGTNPVEGVDYPAAEFVEVAPSGPVVLGKPASETTYGWDNEYGSKQVDVAPFRVSKYLVSNGEFLEFVKDDGYLDPELWSTNGWAWRTFRNAKWPTFWRQFGPAGLHEYKLRSVFEEHEMPWDWPADLNYYEVEAYANYVARKSGTATRVVTEPEHAAMRGSYATPQDFVTTDASGAVGTDAGAAELPNLNMIWGSHTPVNGTAPSPEGVHDVMGNVWQWCEDHFSPLPGFATHPYYPDFSMPCFDGEHNIIMGGSFMATGNEASTHARFHFRPHFYQHAGGRLVQPVDPDAPLVTSCVGCEGPWVGSESPFRDAPAASVVSAPASGSGPVAVGSTDGVVEKYEDRKVVDQYLNMHYGRPDEFPSYIAAETLEFPQRCAGLVEKYSLSTNPRGRALDVGCAVGASAFELARTFQHVTALDISHAFVEAAKYMQTHKHLEYSIQREGSVMDTFTASVDSSIDTSRVAFGVGDATALDPAELGTFDGVLVGNVLCRLPDPYLLLDALPGLVNPEGTLVITSPFSWLPQFTPQDKWLSSGPDASSAPALKAALARDFDIVHEGDIPFVIREHIRKYEYVAAHLGVWRRRA